LFVVEASPIAAHAINVGIELAGSLKAKSLLFELPRPPVLRMQES